MLHFPFFHSECNYYFLTLSCCVAFLQKPHITGIQGFYRCREQMKWKIKWSCYFLRPWKAASSGLAIESVGRVTSVPCERGCARKSLASANVLLWPTGVSFIINNRIVTIYLEKVRKIFNSSWRGSHRESDYGLYIWIEEGIRLKCPKAQAATNSGKSRLNLKKPEERR